MEIENQYFGCVIAILLNPFLPNDTYLPFSISLSVHFLP